MSTFCIHFGDEDDFVLLANVFGKLVAHQTVEIPAWLETFWQALPNKDQKGFVGEVRCCE